MYVAVGAVVVVVDFNNVTDNKLFINIVSFTLLAAFASAKDVAAVCVALCALWHFSISIVFKLHFDKRFKKKSLHTPNLMFFRLNQVDTKYLNSI